MLGNFFSTIDKRIFELHCRSSPKKINRSLKRSLILLRVSVPPRLSSFIKSSTAMIKEGDAKAVAISKEYNNLLMPDNNYTDAQISSILDYIEQGGSTGDGSIAVPVADILDGTGKENVQDGLDLFSGRRGYCLNSSQKI